MRKYKENYPRDLLVHHQFQRELVCHLQMNLQSTLTIMFVFAIQMQSLSKTQFDLNL